MDSAVEVSDSTTATIGTPSDTFGDGPDLWISRSTCLESVDIPHVCWSEKFLLLLPTCCFSKNITIFCWLNQAESPFLSFSRTRMCSIYMCWYPPNVFLFDVLQLFSAKNVAFPKKKKLCLGVAADQGTVADHIWSGRAGAGKSRWKMRISMGKDHRSQWGIVQPSLITQGYKNLGLFHNK